MRRLLPLLLAFTLLGCTQNNGPRCERLCSKFVNTCAWPAWTSVEQCKQGCIEDLYRRDDAEAVLDCYEEAADPPSAEAAAAAVDEALLIGVYDVQLFQGTFDRERAEEQMTERLTCDPFAAVQCKTRSVLTRPELPLVREDAAR